MKRILMATVLGIVMLTTASGAFADGRLMLQADYNFPMNSEYLSENLSFSAGLRFWGIFFLTGTMYTDIVYGADNVFNVREIVPIGLFSGGLGMHIPMGGVGFMMDWQRFFTGTLSKEGVYDFSNSFKIGLTVEVNEHVGLEFYNRKLYDFSKRAQGSFGFAKNGTVNTFGAGIIIHAL
jgi:hypothetical protein